MAGANSLSKPGVEAGSASTVTVRTPPKGEPAEAGKTAAFAPAELNLVRQIGKYPVKRFLGQGAMGRVYLGEHPELRLPVAVKVIDGRYAADPRYRRRFLQEARLASQINHPNIIRVYDADQEGETCFMVQEYVDGGDVAALLKKGPGGGLALGEALRIARGVASGLAAAERLQIIHRDVKPSNILLTRDGEPKLADLGLARKLPPAGEAASTEMTITHTGSTVGTPAYMAPEQIMTHGSIDIRADIYALGATLFEMVTGQPPFPGANTDEILRRHLHDPVPDPCELNPRLPRRLGRLIQHMLAKRPDDRPPTAAALLDELDRAALPLCRRPTLAWSLAAAAGLAVLALTVAVLVRRGPDPEALKRDTWIKIITGNYGSAAGLDERFPDDRQVTLMVALSHLLAGRTEEASSVRRRLPAGDLAGLDFDKLIGLQNSLGRAEPSSRDTMQALIQTEAMRKLNAVMTDEWTSPHVALVFLPCQADGVSAGRLAETVAWQDSLETGMIAKGPFPVVNREALDRILGELALSVSGLADLAEKRAPIPLGKLLPASIMVQCTFTESKGLRLSLRMTDTSTGEFLEAIVREDLNAKDRAAIVNDLCAELAQRIRDRRLPQGRIEAVTEAEAEINLGRFHGLVPGQELAIYREKDLPSLEKLSGTRPVGTATVSPGSLDRLRAKARLSESARRVAKPGMLVKAVAPVAAAAQ